MPKKSVASKHPRGSSSSEYDRSRFISTNADGRFNASMTRYSRIRERWFDIDVENVRVEDFQRVIHNRGWQLFCKHPNAAAMTVVCELFANALEGMSRHTVFVRGKQVKYEKPPLINSFAYHTTLVAPMRFSTWWTRPIWRRSARPYVKAGALSRRLWGMSMPIFPPRTSSKAWRSGTTSFMLD